VRAIHVVLKLGTAEEQLPIEDFIEVEITKTKAKKTPIVTTPIVATPSRISKSNQEKVLDAI
jgi:hypothetical protein